MRGWSRIVPLSLFTAIAAFCVGWLWPAPRLYADPECSGCTWLQDVGFKAYQCVGRSGRGAAVCTWGSVNEPCVLTGTASWTPLPDAQNSCAVNSGTAGVIGPYGTSNMALFFFNPRTGANPGYGYATTQDCASPSAFGWRMDVIHTWTGAANPCDCTGQQQSLNVGFSIWGCG